MSKQPVPQQVTVGASGAPMALTPRFITSVAPQLQNIAPAPQATAAASQQPGQLTAQLSQAGSPATQGQIGQSMQAMPQFQMVPQQYATAANGVQYAMPSPMFGSQVIIAPGGTMATLPQGLPMATGQPGQIIANGLVATASPQKPGAAAQSAMIASSSPQQQPPNSKAAAPGIPTVVSQASFTLTSGGGLIPTQPTFIMANQVPQPQQQPQQQAAGVATSMASQQIKHGDKTSTVNTPQQQPQPMAMAVQAGQPMAQGQFILPPGSIIGQNQAYIQGNQIFLRPSVPQDPNAATAVAAGQAGQPGQQQIVLSPSTGHAFAPQAIQGSPQQMPAVLGQLQPMLGNQRAPPAVSAPQAPVVTMTTTTQANTTPKGPVARSLAPIKPNISGAKTMATASPVTTSLGMLQPQPPAPISTKLKSKSAGRPPAPPKAAMNALKSASVKGAAATLSPSTSYPGPPNLMSSSASTTLATSTLSQMPVLQPQIPAAPAPIAPTPTAQLSTLPGLAGNDSLPKMPTTSGPLLSASTAVPVTSASSSHAVSRPKQAAVANASSKTKEASRTHEKDRAGKDTGVAGNVLKHFIGGYDILESSEPFPVKKSDTDALRVGDKVTNSAPTTTSSSSSTSSLSSQSVYSNVKTSKTSSTPISTDSPTLSNGSVKAKSAEPVKRGPGRPLGSKNNPDKNGSHSRKRAKNSTQQDMPPPLLSAMEPPIKKPVMLLSPKADPKPSANAGPDKRFANQWTIAEVRQFLKMLDSSTAPPEVVDDFEAQEIDGQALLLLDMPHLRQMNMKVGKAVKLLKVINSLRDEYEKYSN